MTKWWLREYVTESRSWLGKKRKWKRDIQQRNLHVQKSCDQGNMIHQGTERRSCDQGSMVNWRTEKRPGWLEDRQWEAWPDHARPCRPRSDDWSLSILPNLKYPSQQNYWIHSIHSTQYLIMSTPCPQGRLFLYLDWSFWGNTIKRVDEEMNTGARCGSSLALSVY